MKPSASSADFRLGAKPPSSPTLVLWPASCRPFFSAVKISEPMRTASAMVPAPTGWIMNSWMSIGLSACLPPLTMFIIGTGRVRAIDAADIAVERHALIGRRGFGHRERHPEDGVGAEAGLVGRAVEIDQDVVDLDLLRRVHAADGVEDLALDIGDRGLAHALAAVAGIVVVAQLHGLMRAGGGAGGHGGAAHGAAFEDDFGLESGARGRVAVPSGASTDALRPWRSATTMPATAARACARALPPSRARSSGRRLGGMNPCRAGQDRRYPDRSRRHAEQGPPRCQRHPRGVSGNSQSRRRRSGCPALPLVGGVYARTLPLAMKEGVSGGRHARPIEHPGIHDPESITVPLAEAVRHAVSEIFAALKKGLHDAGSSTNVGDEGGFAPNLKSADEALGFIAERPARKPATTRAMTSPSPSTRRPATRPRRAAQTEGRGQPARRRRHGRLPPGPRQPLPYWLHWGRLRRRRAGTYLTTWTKTLGNKIQIVGDDIFVTDPERLRRGGIAEHTANAILVKVNQIGTLAETLETVRTRPPRRLAHGHEPPFRRDRGFDHRRARCRHQLRADETGRKKRIDLQAKSGPTDGIEAELGPAARYAGRHRPPPLIAGD